MLRRLFDWTAIVASALKIIWMLLGWREELKLERAKQRAEDVLLKSTQADRAGAETQEAYQQLNNSIVRLRKNIELLPDSSARRREIEDELEKSIRALGSLGRILEH